jgi:hypothetical protein
MTDTEIQPEKEADQGPKVVRPTFPDPSLSLVEFGDALGLLLAERTERDVANRRLLLKKVVYLRIKEDGWGVTPYPEIWIEQTKEGHFRAVEPRTGDILRYPSRRHYEVSFLTRDIFECAIQCLKERDTRPIYELAMVNFGTREGFSVEAGSLLAPGDYADEREPDQGRQWLPTPMPMEADKKKG